MANYSQRYNATTQTTTAGAFKFDTISAVDWPVAKLIWGEEGATNYASAAAPLPVSAAATDALLTTIDTDTGAIATSAASIDTKTPALGQALAAASVPVVLTAAQVSTLTPPAAITGFATESTLGTLSAKFATGTVIGDVNLGATDNAVLDAIAASAAAIQAGQLPDSHNVTIDNASVAVTGTFWQATQPVSGTVAVTGTQTDALTDTQLRATAVPVSAASLPLPSGASTEATLSSLNGKVTACNTGAVVISSALPAGTNNIGDVDVVSCALPAGAASLAEQQEQTTNLSNIQGFSENIQTAVQLIDDAIVAVDAVGTSAKVIMGGAIRDDALSTLTPVEGDAVNLRTNENGALWVIPSGTTTIAGAVTNAGTFAVQVSSALPAGTNNIGDVDVLSLPSITGTVTANAGTNLNTSALALESGGNLATIRGAVYNDTLTSGWGVNGVQMLGYSEDMGGPSTLTLDDAGMLKVIASIGTTLTVQGSIAHDGVIAAEQPFLIAGYASAAAPSDVSGDGDAARAWFLRNGSQVCNLAVGGTLVTASAGLPVAGGVSHDSADSGAPHKQGARAKGSLSAITLVSADDRTDLFAGLDGIQIVRPHSPLEDLVSGVAAITDGSSTSVIGAQGAGVKTYITSVTIANTSATPVTVDLRDGTAGSVKWTFPVPADTAGVVHTFPTPLGFSANTIVAADPSASATTITVSLSGFKSKV